MRALLASIEVVALLVIASAVACRQDSTAPHSGPPGIEIVAGNNVTDTAYAVIPLKVVVRDQHGALLKNAQVEFTSIPVSGSVLLGGPTPNRVGSSVLWQLTDDGGSAIAPTTLVATGAAEVEIRVPSAGYADTAHYTVETGSAFAIELLMFGDVSPPAEKEVMTNANVWISAVVVDVAGNRRPDSVSYSSPSPSVSVTSAPPQSYNPWLVTVSSAEVGRVPIIASTANAKVRPETTWVTVVPHGAVAMMYPQPFCNPSTGACGPRLLLFLFSESYLSGGISFVGYAGAPVEWQPDGSGVLIPQLSDVTGSLFSFGGGPLTPVMPYQTDPTTHSALKIHSFVESAQGPTIYFSARGVLSRYVVGSSNAPERLTSPNDTAAAFAGSMAQVWPTISPDGTQLVYETDSLVNNAWTYMLQRMDVATKTITPLQLAGQRPRYSPTGDLIAYLSGEQVWVAKPDGSGARAVSVSSSGKAYGAGVSWTNDGQWILTRELVGDTTNLLVLLNVQNGQELPLPLTRQFGDTAFRGTPAVLSPGPDPAVYRRAPYANVRRGAAAKP